jgi:fructose-1,6-bisphosphatase I
MAGRPMTLVEHLAAQRAFLSVGDGPSVSTLLGCLGRVAAAIAQELSHAALRGRLGYAGGTNVTGDQVRKLDVWGHETMLGALRATGACASLISEESPAPIEIADGDAHALIVCADPVDGSSNLDVNGAVGTIFSLRPSKGRAPAGPAALGPGTDQLAAGYVMYGPGTSFVYSVGQGVHGFVLDPDTQEFLLTHPRIEIPKRGKTYGINEGNIHTWHPGQRAFVEYLKTPERARGRPYSLRYSGSMVADVHRTLLNGGVFMYPADWTDPQEPRSKLRLLYEVAPIGFVIEQAGGRASTGLQRVLDVIATEYHQRTAVILGSPEDVSLAEEFYRGRGA